LLALKQSKKDLDVDVMVEAEAGRVIMQEQEQEQETQDAIFPHIKAYSKNQKQQKKEEAGAGRVL